MAGTPCARWWWAGRLDCRRNLMTESREEPQSRAPEPPRSHVPPPPGSPVPAPIVIPERTKARLLPGALGRWLDGASARVGLSRERSERLLDRALTFDDDVAEALYSKHRTVRTYQRSEVTPLRNNYDGMTPGPEYLA